MSAASTVRAVAQALGTPSAQAEARTLVAHVLGVAPSVLALATAPDPTQQAALDVLVARRRAGEPLQHLTGLAHFRHVSLQVGPGVFVPRPETEVMTGWAIDRLVELGRPARVVELCAGSGAISKALVDELGAQVSVHAVELSEAAATYAEANLAGTGVELIVGDMADAFRELDGCVDLVIANPPYIPLDAWESGAPDGRDHDPAIALYSGTGGLDAMRVGVDVAARLLVPDGWVCAEHAEVQSESAPALFVRHGGFDHVRDERDLAGRARFVTARRRGASLRRPGMAG